MRKYFVVSAMIAALVLLPFTYFFVLNYVYVNPSKQTLTIFCATSLLYLIQKVQTVFEKAYPDTSEVEGHGSIQVIRQVTELGYSVDLLMVADYSHLNPKRWGWT